MIEVVRGEGYSWRGAEEVKMKKSRVPLGAKCQQMFFMTTSDEEALSHLGKCFSLLTERISTWVFPKLVSPRETYESHLLQDSLSEF